MSSYYNNYFWQLRELQKALESMRPQWDQIQTLPQIVLDQIEQFNKIEEQYTLPADYLSAIDEVQKAIQGSLLLEEFRALSESRTPVFEQLRNELKAFDSVGVTILDTLELYRPVTEMIVDSLAPIEALLRTGRIAAEEIDALLVPQRAFQQFASEQLKPVAEQSSQLAADFRAALVLKSGGLLDDMVGGFELGALMRHQVPQPASFDYGLPFGQVLQKNNLFARLAVRVEEIDPETPEAEAEALVLESCESRLAGLGYHLVRLVHDLNEEAEREGQEVPFKPSTRTLYACGTISSVSVSDSVSFNVVVDQLFFLLYEGTGEAKRLIQKWGKEPLGALWRLKHLRLNARHDVAHGKKQGIEGKQKKIGQAFKELIGTVTPKKEADWCRAQVALYEQLIEMLERLWYGDDEDGGSSSDAVDARVSRVRRVPRKL